MVQALGTTCSPSPFRSGGTNQLSCGTPFHHDAAASEPWTESPELWVELDLSSFKSWGSGAVSQETKAPRLPWSPMSHSQLPVITLPAAWAGSDLTLMSDCQGPLWFLTPTEKGGERSDGILAKSVWMKTKQNTCCHMERGFWVRNCMAPWDSQSSTSPMIF